MVDVVAGHLGTNWMHGWTAWQLGLSHLCLVRTEQALLGPFGASQSWLVIQKSHRNRAVLRFYGIGHISWDKSNEFDLDRWMRVDGFFWVNIDQFVSWDFLFKAKTLMAYVLLTYYTFILWQLWIEELIWRLVLLLFFFSMLWMCNWS